MSLTRACLGVAGSEANALGAKIRSIVSIRALQKYELLTCILNAFDAFDLLISVHIIPR
jgi:hypothetical protein